MRPWSMRRTQTYSSNFPFENPLIDRPINARRRDFGPGKRGIVTEFEGSSSPIQLVGRDFYGYPLSRIRAVR